MSNQPLFQYTAVKRMVARMAKTSSFQADMGDEATGWKDSAYKELLRKHPWLSRYNVVCEITATDDDTAAVGHFIVSEKRLPASAVSISDDQNRIMIPIIIEKRRLKPLDMFSFRLTYYPLSEARAVPILTSSELFMDVGWGEADSLRKIENGMLGRSRSGGFGGLARLLPNFKQSGMLTAVATSELPADTRPVTVLARSVLADSADLLKASCAKNRDLVPLMYSLAGRVTPTKTSSVSSGASDISAELKRAEAELYATRAKVAGIEFRSSDDSYYARGIWAASPEDGRVSIGNWKPERASRIVKLAGAAALQALCNDGKFLLNLNEQSDGVSLRKLSSIADQYETQVIRGQLRKLSEEGKLNTQRQRVALMFEKEIPGLLPSVAEAWVCRTRVEDTEYPANSCAYLLSNGQIIVTEWKRFEPECVIPLPWAEPPTPTGLVRPLSANREAEIFDKPASAAIYRDQAGVITVMLTDGGTLQRESGERMMVAVPLDGGKLDNVLESEFNKIPLEDGLKPVPAWKSMSDPDLDTDSDMEDEDSVPVSLEKVSESEYRVTGPIPSSVEMLLRDGSVPDAHVARACLCAMGLTSKQSEALFAWADRFHADGVGGAAPATVKMSHIGHTHRQVRSMVDETRRRFERTDAVATRLMRHRANSIKVASDLFAATRTDPKLSSDIGGVDPGVDTLLSLGFLTRQNVLRFAEAADDMQRTQSQLCALTIACRLGLRDIPEEACINAVQHLEEVITSLKAIRHLLAN